MFLGAQRLLVRLHSRVTVETKSKNARWMEMLLIRFSSRCAVTKWTSHRKVGVMEESKKQVPARHTDQHRHTNSMTQRRKPHQIERLLCQHGTACVKTEGWSAVSLSTTTITIGCWLCCCVVTIYLPECSSSPHVNFDSVVLSDLDFSARLIALTRGRGLAFTFARVPV